MSVAANKMWQSLFLVVFSFQAILPSSTAFRSLSEICQSQTYVISPKLGTEGHDLLARPAGVACILADLFTRGDYGIGRALKEPKLELKVLSGQGQSNTNLGSNEYEELSNIIGNSRKGLGPGWSNKLSQYVNSLVGTSRRSPKELAAELQYRLKSNQSKNDEGVMKTLSGLEAFNPKLSLMGAAEQLADTNSLRGSVRPLFAEGYGNGKLLESIENSANKFWNDNVLENGNPINLLPTNTLGGYEMIKLKPLLYQPDEVLQENTSKRFTALEQTLQNAEVPSLTGSASSTVAGAAPYYNYEDRKIPLTTKYRYPLGSNLGPLLESLTVPLPPILSFQPRNLQQSNSKRLNNLPENFTGLKLVQQPENTNIPQAAGALFIYERDPFIFPDMI